MIPQQACRHRYKRDTTQYCTKQMWVYTTLPQEHTNKIDCLTPMLPKTSVCQYPIGTSHFRVFHTCFIAEFNYFLQTWCFAFWFLIVTFYWGVISNFTQTSYRLYLNFLTYFKQQKKMVGQYALSPSPNQNAIFIHWLSDSQQTVKFKATDAMTSQPHRHVFLGMTNHCLLLSMNSLVRLPVISSLHCGSMHKKAGQNSDYCWKHFFLIFKLYS
jgi:hypothetical protein